MTTAQQREEFRDFIREIIRITREIAQTGEAGKITKNITHQDGTLTNASVPISVHEALNYQSAIEWANSLKQELDKRCLSAAQETKTPTVSRSARDSHGAKTTTIPKQQQQPQEQFQRDLEFTKQQLAQRQKWQA